MSELSALRAAIVGVCDGTLGTVRTVATAGTEHATASPQNSRVRALLSPKFDVTFQRSARHPASPLGTSTREIKTVEVRIDIEHAIDVEEILDEERNAIRDAVHEACDEIVAALSYPGNLLVDGEANATGCVDGMLSGENGAPTWEVVGEDLEAKLIRSQIRGTAYVLHARAVAA